MYFYGDGVLQNVVTARQWLMQAADRNDAAAQRLLGEIYAKGLGIAKDPAEAYAWFNISAKDGDAEAASERDRLLPSLSPTQLDRAQLLAADRTSTAAPHPPDTASNS